MLTALIHNDKSDERLRVHRDLRIPLTRITLLCGPNGSGKSTVLSAFEHFVLKNNAGRPWTAKTAPSLVEGDLEGNIVFFSMEKDNPRLADVRYMKGDAYMATMLSKFKSHGQSNYAFLQSLVNDGHAMIVLDEPESALDVHGLLWLRDAILKSDKQFLIATHSPILLQMTVDGAASTQCFGPDANYAETVMRTYREVLAGLAVAAPSAQERLPHYVMDQEPELRKSGSKMRSSKG